jgi:hypothetical protein
MTASGLASKPAQRDYLAGRATTLRAFGRSGPAGRPDLIWTALTVDHGVVSADRQPSSRELAALVVVRKRLAAAAAEIAELEAQLDRNSRTLVPAVVIGWSGHTGALTGASKPATGLATLRRHDRVL